MIKNFNTYINEDYFSKLASRKDSGNVRKENEITEDFVRSFICEGCEYTVKSISILKYDNKVVVDIDGDFYLREDIEEIPFQFGKVSGEFNCSSCNLTSLKGCPKEVGRTFNCENNHKLKSLEYCTEKVGGTFDCRGCNVVKSLKGCPKEVGRNFYCIYCGKKFTEEEVKSLCDVKGKIVV